MTKYSAKKMIMEMTYCLENLHKYDIESASMALQMRQLRQEVMIGKIMNSSNVPTIADMYDLFIDYSDKSEVINKQVERLCQLILMNEEIVYNTDDIPQDEKENILLKVDDIIYKISVRRMNSLEMRKWIVQMQIGSMMK